MVISGITLYWGSSPLPMGERDPYLLQCYLGYPAKWHLIPSNGFSMMHQCDRWHTYRWTDHNTVTRAEIGRRCRLIILLFFKGQLCSKFGEDQSKFCPHRDRETKGEMNEQTDKRPVRLILCSVKWQWRQRHHSVWDILSDVLRGNAVCLLR